MLNVIIPITNGSEETETVTVVDVLRRAGWDVTLAGINGPGPVTASRGVQLVPDTQWEQTDLSTFDMIVLPGGMEGTLAFCNNDGVQEALRIFDIEELWIGAICAAPLALHQAGILKKHAFTCYPGAEQKMNRPDRSDDAVVVSHHIVTSQAPGTAIPFALKLIELAENKEAADRVADGLLWNA